MRSRTLRCCCSPRSIRRDLWAKRTVCVRVGRVMWRFDLQFNCGTTWPWVLYRRHHHSIWLVSIALRALLAVKQIRTPHRLVVFIFRERKKKNPHFLVFCFLFYDQVSRRFGHAVWPDGRRVVVRDVPRPRNHVPCGASSPLYGE